jgi:hypothetical protein
MRSTLAKIFLVAGVTAVSAYAVSDTVTVRNPGAAQTNRPVSFPRYFVEGEIPTCAQAVQNGNALTTQCDVKTRWSDGSVQFAMISFVIPALDAEGSYTVTFQDQTCSTAGYLTKQQILNADAPWSANLGAQIVTANGDAVQSFDLRNMLNDWDGVDGGANGLDVRYWLKGPVVSQLIVENKSTRAYDAGWQHQSVTVSGAMPTGAVGSSIPITVSDGSRLQVGDILKIESERVQVSAVAGNTATIARGYGVTGSCSTVTGGVPGCPATHTNGAAAYILRTAAVDTVNRSLHPIFVVTVWNTWAVVKIQMILENDWTTALQAQTFDLSVATGNPLGAPQWAHPALTQYARTRIERTFWVGAPFGNYGLADDIKIDLNLAYLAESRLVPNYDLTKHPHRSDVLAFDTNVWNAFSPAQKDVNGDDALNLGTTGESGPRAGSFPKSMQQGGQTQKDWIGILPAWAVRYLYTMSDPAVLPSDTFPMLFGNADASGYVPMHLREGRTGATPYCAHSCTGADLAMGAYGWPVSVDARPTLRQHEQSLGISGSGADGITPAGSVWTDNWIVDTAHQPAHAFSAYLLTGDWYWLEEMEFWAAQNSIAFAAGDGLTSRGHNGWEAILITGSERMDAWPLRTMGQLALLIPDAQSAKKAYWNSKMANNIAAKEGKYSITDGHYYSTAIWNWANNTPCADFSGNANEHLGCARDSQVNALYFTEPTSLFNAGRKTLDLLGEANGNTSSWVQPIVSISDNGAGLTRITHAAVTYGPRQHALMTTADPQDRYLFLTYVTDGSGTPLDGRHFQIGTDQQTYVDIDAPYNPPYTIGRYAKLIWRGQGQTKEVNAWYSGEDNSPFMFFFTWGVDGYLNDLGFPWEPINRKLYRVLIHSFSNNLTGDGFTQDILGSEFPGGTGSAVPVAKLVKIGDTWYQDSLDTYAEFMQGLGDVATLKANYAAACAAAASAYCHIHRGVLSFAYPYDDNMGTTGAIAWANALANTPAQAVLNGNPKWAFVPRPTRAGGIGLRRSGLHGRSVIR